MFTNGCRRVVRSFARICSEDGTTTWVMRGWLKAKPFSVNEALFPITITTRLTFLDAQNEQESQQHSLQDFHLWHFGRGNCKYTTGRIEEACVFANDGSAKLLFWFACKCFLLVCRNVWRMMCSPSDIDTAGVHPCGTHTYCTVHHVHHSRRDTKSHSYCRRSSLCTDGSWRVLFSHKPIDRLLFSWHRRV